MWRRRERNDWIAVCYATEPTGEFLAQDIWYFTMTDYSVRRLWRQIQVWNAQYGHDPRYTWGMAPRNHMRS